MGSRSPREAREQTRLGEDKGEESVDRQMVTAAGLSIGARASCVLVQGHRSILTSIFAWEAPSHREKTLENIV